MIRKLSYWLDVTSRVFIVFFLILMTLVLATQVVLRYFFHMGIIWSDELARFLMIALVYIGAASAIRDNSHIKVSVFEDEFPGLRKWFAPIQWVMIFIYSVFLIKFGFDTLKVVGTQNSSNMEISMAWIYVVIPLSGILTIVHLLARVGKKNEGQEETV
ncbi:TRAP transporter small permease [Sporosarcina newyorkensis]|uniref:TRAP-type C4-dicarboxylate transport system, small permease component n=1 Tax=Sporosarcina newyorkensis TaxID=759851 RepID=A0A1T4Y8E3_9BACL|nr:TRAP transporter small permease [Sporosarcina newyorkensis]SKA97960.1 TRAP-type C4-dicarboxylate transport system, small permease component [Sporosarcina newyorkensis]